MSTSNDLLPLKQWIMQHLGIKVHDHQQANLAKAMHHLIESQQIIHMQDLIAKLNQHDAEITNQIIKAITVQESYFFRDQSLFIFLKETALPELIQKRRQEGNLTLNIWSAGCATGEEIYSIAILLYELLPDIHQWRLYLFGSDIQENALALARKAQYTRASLRATSEKDQQRYFTPHANYYLLKPEIRALAQFGNVNLASQNYPAVRFDIILCRNVFIYFTQETIEHALINFKNCLGDGGHLFLGASDFISYVDHNFKQKIENGITYLIKSVPQPSHHITQTHSTTIHKPSPYFEVQAQKSSALKEITESFNAQLYQKTLKLIDAYIDNYGNSDLLYQYKAAALLELGDMNTALEYCNKAIKTHRNNPYIYFIKAMIAMDNQSTQEAEQLLKQALQINSRFAEAQYYLGSLLLRDHRMQEGLLALQQALSLAKTKTADERVFGSSKETIADMIIAIQNDIHFYEARIYGK